MSLEPETLPPVHEVVLLLPWYLSGRLSESERQDVERHLSGCEECRQELAQLQSLRADYRALQDSEPGPSASVRDALLAKLSPRPSQPPSRELRRPRWLEGLSDVFRPAWVQIAVSLLVMTQFAVLGSLLLGSPKAAVITRAVVQQPSRLRISFVDTASQARVVSALREINGRITAGPDDSGAYVVELAPQSPAELARRLKALRDQSDLVRELDLVPP